MTMGLMSLPTTLKHGYSPRLASGVIAASGTLGQIIPPSIVLVILRDQLSNAYRRAQLDAGNFAPDSVRTSDIYRGIVPFVGIQLLVLLLLWFAPHLATWLPGVIYG
ncbi:TRAP transporter large permease subunit [Breoghania sp. L-A4]|uniref:TRAP transporter large permease subunit n=1 Tax=Breoghania sp. L-A4 TaxID=2304600 RepID=UPI000E35F9D1|nr:TRAP transporter large permease subunit [Breoghania sp. L-A4]AXS41890.1 TRAP transporter large permease subunit [Breoghania sp. L-A4]